MTIPAHLDPARKHDFVFLFDIVDGNPNGDPDNGGAPRTDPITMQGYVTDVALKRKIRNTVALLNAGRPGYDIYVEAGVALNAQHERAYDTGGAANESEARDWMCQTFYDVRMMGAVMTTGKNRDRTAGRVQGPLQLTFSRSIDPVTTIEVPITRVTPTRVEDLATKQTEMGTKNIVPYGLYRGAGHFSAPLAAKTGVTSDDLHALWQAFEMMLEHDRAAARASMALRGLWVFSHSDAYGQTPAHKLLDRVHVTPLGHTAARSYSDYKVTVDADVPEGISLTALVD
ncbi:type I-C CRISPR-associated protein Cas7/Csd2 [Kitasatospora sp. NPDC088779]|uniref:type I-C CRISPR-associated protein Cas7/Csd2 n=1 Tax=unclassified Kitasatospora TaxID=2633591 RepID=UPI003438140E